MSDLRLLFEAWDAASQGDRERVLELFSRVDLAALGDTERLRWCLLLAEAGELKPARDLATTVADPSGVELLRSLLGPEAFPKPDAVAEDEEDGFDPFALDLPPRARPADERIVELFLRWFGGRRDLYARQWFDERRRRNGYRPVEAPLTAEVVRAHLEGRITVGQYLLFPDATCSFAAIDLDLGASALEAVRAARGPEVSPLEHAELRAFALRLIDAGARLGLPLFPEDSGGRGLHLWLFLEPRRPARAARALLSQVLSAAGPVPPEVGVELFPKQERVGPRGLSSLVKLPLGVHLATLRRCALLDERLVAIEDPREALERLRAPEAATVEALLARRVVALPAPELAPLEAVPELPQGSSPRSLAEALRAVSAGREEKDACERMLSGCAPLAAIVRRAFEERRLAADEARAVVYTLGLVGPSCALAEETLAAAQASTKELHRVRRGLPSPMGCAKLRAIAREASGDCPCAAVAKAQPYATPAVLAVGSRAPAPPRAAPFAAWLEADESAVQSPIDAIGEVLARIEQRLARLEGAKEGERAK